MASISINYPFFQAFDDNANYLVGGLVWTYEPATTTPQATYYDKGLQFANTNPVVLDALGEAVIYTGEAVKLVLTVAGGDPSSPIWTADYIGGSQETFVTGVATPVTLNNNYIVTTVPTISSLSNNFSLIMTPDVDNADTIVSTVFTGTGINDLTASGPYVGSTSGSIFTIQIDSTVEAVPIAPTAVLSATAGTVTAGNHYVKMTAVTAAGETPPGDVSALVVGNGSKKIDVSNIPALTGQVTGYNLYMNPATGAVGTYYLVNAAPITATTYALDITDATLITHAVAPTTNTTGSGGADTFKWKKDGGAWHLGVVITSAAQILIEGFTVTFASITGHTLNDIWAVTVKTPATVNLDSLGAFIVYKNKGGQIVPLDGGDMQAGYAAELVMNGGINAWLLVNPASPIISSPTISATRYRNNVTADYDMVLSDQGKEISCIGTFTVTLLKCPDFAHRFVYIRNTGNGVITVDAQGYLIKGYGSVAGVTQFTLARIIECIQLETDGIDWHILTTVISPVSSHSGEGAGPTGGLDVYSTPGTFYWTCPAGVTSVDITRKGGGGGGGSSWLDATNYGDAGADGASATDLAQVVVPGTSYAVVVGAGGAGADYSPVATPAIAGSAGGSSSFGGGSAAAGGAGGIGNDGTQVQSDSVPSGNGGWGAGNNSNRYGADGGPGQVRIAY